MKPEEIKNLEQELNEEELIEVAGGKEEQTDERIIRKLGKAL